MKHNTSIAVNADTIAALREIAASLGYIADRGVLRGQGSVSGLMDAIARGEVSVSK